MADSRNANFLPPQYYNNDPKSPAGMQQQHHTTNTIIVQQQQPNVIIIERSPFPSVNKCLAIIILILNIIFPGVGTIVMGCSSQNCSEWLCTGILQIILFPLLIGWIWAICTGIKCLNHSR